MKMHCYFLLNIKHEANQCVIKTVRRENSRPSFGFNVKTEEPPRAGSTLGLMI